MVKEFIMPIDDEANDWDEMFIFTIRKQSELIRCKDCKYYLKSDEECQLINTRLHFYEENKKWTKESFCSWAERKAEE